MFCIRRDVQVRSLKRGSQEVVVNPRSPHIATLVIAVLSLLPLHRPARAQEKEQAELAKLN